jgi:hypothetical protein
VAKLALVLAFLAAGVAGWLVAGRQCLECELAQLREAHEAADARLMSLERTLARLEGARGPEEPLSAPLAHNAPGATTGSTPSGGPGLVPTPRAAATVEQRIEQLERQLATAQAASEGAKAEASAARPSFAFSSHGFLGSIEQVCEALELDPSQKAGIERVIEQVERELKDLSTRPNEEGKTLKELQEGWQPEAVMGEEGMAKFHEHMAEVSRLRQSKVPGTNETYAQAERRLRKDGKARARSFLSPEQAKTWDRSHTDMLFGGGGGAVSASIVSFESGPALEVVLPK